MNADGEGLVRWVCVVCGKKALRKLGCVVHRDRAVCFDCWKASGVAWDAKWDEDPAAQVVPAQPELPCP